MRNVNKSKLETFESETVIGPYGTYIRVNFNSETISEHTVSSPESLLVTFESETTTDQCRTHLRVAFESETK